MASDDRRDLALGLAVAGARVAYASGKLVLLPLRVAARAPVVGGALRDAERRLTSEGVVARERGRARLEQEIDRALAGPLIDAMARSLAEHRVTERVASEMLDALDLDRVVDAVLGDERTERLVVRVMESRLLDDLTERVIESPELQRVVEHVAASPAVLAALSHHTETLAEEMVTDVRRRSQKVDDLAERTVRGWLRRPRASPS